MAATIRRGVKLGKYLLERKLGQGGFAQVWRAKDTVENHRVAIKIADSRVASEAAPGELEREARLTLRLRHPNIVAVRNADWIAGRFVIAAPLARCNLAVYKRARRSPRVALSIIHQIAAALAHAHRHRVMHRDVKPENVLIFDGDRAALADFGVSTPARSMARTYSEVGTLGYVAPEQAYGRPGYGSDVFSLGIIAYDLLAGVVMRWPFEWPSEGFARLKKRVPPPVLPVIRKAVQFDPRKRYVDGAELLAALEKALAAAEPRAPKKPPKLARKRAKAPAPVDPLALAARSFQHRHGRGLDMRYTCYRCEGTLSEAMRWCPWCGVDHHSFREISEFPLVCPECEHGVHAEWDYCPWCFKGRFTSNGKEPRKDTKAVRICSKAGCNGQLRPFMRYCPRCKQQPKRGWTHPELRERCTRCRWPISKSFWRFCPWCGRSNPDAGRYRSRKSTAPGR